MLALVTQGLDERRPPGSAAFLLALSATLLELADAASLVADHHIDIGEGRAQRAHTHEGEQ
jgi:hypothetical protein